MPRTDSSSRPRKLLLGFLALLLFNSAFLAVSNRLPGPPRLPITAFFYMGNVMLHLLLGMTAFYVLHRLRPAWVRAIRNTPGGFGWLGGVCGVALVVSLWAGVALLIWGNLRPMELVLRIHGWGALIAAVTGALWLATWAGAAAEQAWRKPAVALVSVAVVPGLLLMWGASRMSYAEGRILNDTLAPASMNGEGGGPSGNFWPSSAEKVDQGFFPPEYFTDNKSCGEPGCHPDIYKQWYSSAHHFASFNNQWYRKSIEYMQEVIGTKSSKWCGGCHDMAVLLTEMPHTGKSRFEYPIKDQIWPVADHPEAHAGIGCAVCHSMVHIDSTMGNADYLADYPPMHRFVISKNPLLRWTTKWLTRLAPDPHRKTFLKPFHTMDTAKFCSACHKVHLDVPVNNYRWSRGFDEYDAWQASGVSGFGARSFYYPNKDGKPDFKKCADCHMPLTASHDAGNLAGFVHNHRFPAANTALPWVNHDTEQLQIVQKFLQDKALSIDIFALRREQTGDGGRKTDGSRSGARPSTVTRHPSPAERPEGQESSLVGEVATSGNAAPLMPVSTQKVNETVVAPISDGSVAVQRGQDALIDVVVRTRTVGHAFPGGTFDAFDVWVELKAVDDRGKTLFWSGCLQWPDGPIEPSAHEYRVLQVDGHSHPINKRNAWSARARVYAHAIPPGAADTIHYRLHIPKDCGKKITLTAKLNYRKFSWWNTQFAFCGRPEMAGDPNYSKNGFIQGTAVAKFADGRPKPAGPVTVNYDDRPMKFDSSLAVVAGKDRAIPNIPITTICQNTATLDVVDRNPQAVTAPRKLDPKKDRERWNDYGIGLMLQGDFARATKAFDQVVKIAPKWPEGYVNIGRVRLLEGDLKEAEAQFEKALAMYGSAQPNVPPAMIPYLRARTQFFYGTVLKEQGRYEEALSVWQDAARIFPDDRELRNQMGRVYFLEAKFQPAVDEFNHVLTIDPEDLTAHYNLMLCYRGLGDAVHEKEHQALYYRFRNDETTTHLIGPYKEQHPDDNNESIPVHEHGDAKHYTLPARPGPLNFARSRPDRTVAVSLLAGGRRPKAGGGPMRRASRDVRHT